MIDFTINENIKHFYDDADIIMNDEFNKKILTNELMRRFKDKLREIKFTKETYSEVILIDIGENETFNDALRRNGFKNILSEEESEKLLRSFVDSSKAKIS